jgi:hypothetical protein
MHVRMSIWSILGEKLLGIVDSYRYPELRKPWARRPFNGQTFRQQLFRDLIQRISLSAIVETGTFRGTTTEYLHTSSQLPVYTAELHRGYYGYAKRRFVMNPNIMIYHSDSRSFLRDLLNKPIFNQEKVFFYLDAHGGEDLPLREELQIIFEKCAKAVVMVDDFKVPFDDGYRYDNYGEGKVLCFEYLAPLQDQYRFAAFFPSQGADLESGAKRGCVVLAVEPDIVEELRDVGTLVPYFQENA